LTTEVFAKIERNTIVRHPERASYERESVYAIVDEALICHVGFVDDGVPYVIPTLHARDGDRLLLHGSSASRMLRHLATGAPVCVTMTLLDGLVLARSVFSHSVNYRSVVILGCAESIEPPDAKRSALEKFVERMLPGRTADARAPTEQELKSTGVVAIPLETASAKVRVGGPKDPIDDVGLPVWAGTLPVRPVFGEPQPAADLPVGQRLPDYLRTFLQARGS